MESKNNLYFYSEYSDAIKHFLQPPGRGSYRACFSACIGCVVLLFLLSCSTIKKHNAPDNQEILPYQLIEDVPFFPQNDFQCGPSSLAGVLNYYGKNISPLLIADKIFQQKVRGTLSIDMALFARELGFISQWYAGDMNDLRKNIDNDHPLIVMVDLGFGPVHKHHYLVVVGYESKGVIVNSGAHQNKRVPWNRFQNQWSRAQFWTLRILPENNL